jgi:ankyrin repeat protein
MLAAEVGCEECVALLLAARADVSAVAAGGQTALGLAAESGRTAIVGKLVAAGAPLESRIDASGSGYPPRVAGATPLWVAAYRGDLDIVRTLLAAGADREAAALCSGHRRAQPGERECTVRRIAELQEREAVVALLEGREPTAARPAPARKAAAPPPTAAEILAMVGTDRRASREIAAVVNRGDLPLFRALLDGGLSPETLVCHSGRLPLLSYTILRGRTPMMNLLIERGASVESRSLGRPGRNLLMTGFSDFEMLAGPQAQDCPKDEDGRGDVPVFTPLMYAALSKNMDALDKLIAAGAAVDARSIDGLTALMAAAGKNQAWSVRRLLAAGAKVDAAIENPERKDEFNADRATALWLAAFNGSADAAQALLDAGANPAVEAQCRSSLASPGESLCTPRRIAALRGHERVVQVIDARAAPRP